MTGGAPRGSTVSYFEDTDDIDGELTRADGFLPVPKDLRLLRESVQMKIL